jgi:hypothetical protein
MVRARLPATLAAGKLSGTDERSAVMTLFWVLVAPLVIILDVITIVDIVRRHYGGGTTAGWIVLVVILPFVGPLIYWVTRKPPPEAAEQIYRGDAERRRTGV